MNTYTRWVTMAALCMSGGIIFMLPFLRENYKIPMQSAFGFSNTEMGILMSVFGTMSMLTYFPGGWLADRFQPRYLMTGALLATGAVGFCFSTFPSYDVSLIIHGFWGVSISLVFWSAMIKATRNWAEPGEQGRAFGFLEGGRGFTEASTGTLFGLVFVWLGSNDFALSQVIILFSSANILLAIFVWFTMDSERPAQGNKPGNGVNLAEIIEVLKMPEIWLITIVIMASYSGYWGAYAFAPFATSAFSVSVGIGVAIGVGKVWLNPIASVTSGFFSDKIGISRSVCGLLGFLVITFFVFGILPHSPNMIVFMVINVALTAFAIFAIRAIYFALLDEGGIPARVTGTAAGLVSALGFLPDVYMPYIEGVLLDAYPGTEGYRYYYFMISAMCFIGFLAALTIWRRTDKRKLTNLRIDSERILQNE